MKTDFEVMALMSKEGKDIRSTTTLVSLAKTKQGGNITFGVSPETYQDLSESIGFGTGKYICVMYVLNAEQFFETQGKEKDEI